MVALGLGLGFWLLDLEFHLELGLSWLGFILRLGLIWLGFGLALEIGLDGDYD